MRTTRGALVALVLWCGFGAGRAAAQGGWVGGAPLQERIVVGGETEAWVGVWVDAPNVAVVPRARAPMAVSLVIDTSGSMAGDKIQNARMAAASLVESLADGDIVSIYGFSDGVTEIASPTLLSPASREWMMQRVSMIAAAGGTNLWSGMQAAVARMAEAPATHPVRRIFLVSDGRANIGPSDVGSLGDLAARATEWGTQITAIGVGYDYDPTTLQAMVVRSAGRLHHLGAPHQMAAILEAELHRLQRAVALNANVEIVPAPGVTILAAATTGAIVESNRLRFSLGTMDAGQRREILFRVRLPAGSVGPRTLGRAQFTFENPDTRAPVTQTAELRYEVTADRALADRARPTPRVAAMVADHEANVAQRAAADALARGDAERAARTLAQARAGLDRAAQALTDDPVAAGRVRTRASAIATDEQRARSARDVEQMRVRSYELQAAPMAAEGY